MYYCRGANVGTPILKDEGIAEMTKVGSQGEGCEGVSMNQLRFPCISV